LGKENEWSVKKRRGRSKEASFKRIKIDKLCQGSRDDKERNTKGRLYTKGVVSWHWKKKIGEEGGKSKTLSESSKE
jgi:hypothetical protein